MKVLKNLKPEMSQHIMNCYEKHFHSCEVWEHGEPVKVWIDDDNILCIQYADGQWWHYEGIGNSIRWW